MHIRHSLLVIDHCSLVIASRRAEMCLPYPRSPLGEFTPCAPGRSIPSHQGANPIHHRNAKPTFCKPADVPEIIASPSADPREPL